MQQILLCQEIYMRDTIMYLEAPLQIMIFLASNTSFSEFGTKNAGEIYIFFRNGLF